MKNRHWTKFKYSGKKISRFFHRYINGTKGVISIFLMILMVPFVSIAGVLISAARLESAIAIFDECLCNASNSTLGTYDEFLRSRFGLLAISQDSSGRGGGYTGEQFIDDTFRRYMEENLKVLSKTYTTVECSASGVYPLSDTDVLLAELMESGKYNVPTKIVIDGLSIDSIISSLTKSADVVGKFLDVGTSMVGKEEKTSGCQEKMNTLIELLGQHETTFNEYNLSYSSFDTAVGTYNDKVEEMKREVANCEETVHQAEIALALASEEDYAAASAAVQRARQELEETIQRYHNELIPLRNDVIREKEDYTVKLRALRDKTKDTGDAVRDAQNAIVDTIDSGTELVKNVVDAGVGVVQESSNNNIEELKKNRDEAQKQGSTQAVAELNTQIAEQQRTVADVSNANTLASNALNIPRDTASSALKDFSQAAYHEAYSEMYTITNELLYQVENNYHVASGDVKTEETGAYYHTFSLPLKKDNVVGLMTTFAEDIANSSFLAILKAIVNFIKAIFSFQGLYDRELDANIDTGILPSNRSRVTYPIDNHFADEDKQQSDHYKTLMGEYATSGFSTESVSKFEQTINKIVECIDTISESADDIKLTNVLKKIGELLKAIVELIGSLISLIGQLQEILGKYVYERLLLAGYIGYNTANRTTYTGSSLAGGGYELPPTTSDAEGKSFYGAETEYIIWGSSSELSNQEMIFYIIYILRIIVDVVPTVMNNEVQAIASAAGSATFGILYPVILILYALVEPLIDTVLLVNGGEIPVIKTKVFLTASGIPDLVTELFSITVSDPDKDVAYDEIGGLVKEISPGASYPPRPSASGGDGGSGGESSGGLTEKLKGAFKLDYTQMLIILMLFMNPEVMVKRLGDVIQMESCYYAQHHSTATYAFDLDKSFTYLRASGSFTTNEFIKIANWNLNSSKRVVYRGY